MTGVQVDKRRDLFPTTVFIDGISIMGGIQKEFFQSGIQEDMLSS